LSIFPLCEVEFSSKYKLAFEPYSLTAEQENFVRTKVSTYLGHVCPERVFVPPPDILHKVGNQKYNDGGEVRFDYERPINTFSSSFKYQRFITQPLTPREVWLPGKAIKNNNAFWMTITRQILKCDPVYPSTDEEVLGKTLFGKSQILKFDISGFGFQFLREYLLIAAQLIVEIYPCTFMEEQLEIMTSIFNNVNVEMPDGTFEYPPRGIGLGYYEDLKTIVMMALVYDYHPISLYGDQGLLPVEGMEAISLLQSLHFIIKFEKVEFLSTGEIPCIMWAGRRFIDGQCIKPKVKLDPLMGSFFSRQHWERKLGLRGISEDDPEFYMSIEKRLTCLYERIHGYEFRPGDSKQNFFNGGICLRTPILNGLIKSWKVENMVAPPTNILFDTTYVSPFIPAKKRSVPHKEALLFQKQRKAVYKSSPVIDASVHYYSNPKIIYNKKQSRTDHKMIPTWADLLYVAQYKRTTGVLASGLPPEEIIKAVSRQVFASDPFRARSTGGYEVLTPIRSIRGASEENMDIAVFLASLEQRRVLYVHRTDLDQNPELFTDPMYENTDISRVFKKARQSDRITRSSVNQSSLSLEQGDYDKFYQSVKALRGKDSVLSSISTAINADFGLDTSQVDYDVHHGFIEEDHDYEEIEDYDFDLEDDL
jgi:hypothetical protein